MSKTSNNFCDNAHQEHSEHDHRCPLCDTKDKEVCTATGPTKFMNLNFMCTREAGHSGDHIACGSYTHRVAIWVNQED